MPAGIIILMIVLCAIVLRQMARVVIPIWLIMMIGALAALVFNQITPLRAFHSIEPEVMFYLFGVFLISQAAEESGYLACVTDKIFYPHTYWKSSVVADHCTPWIKCCFLNERHNSYCWYANNITIM